MSADVTAHLAADVARHVTNLDRDGFTIVRDAFDASVAEALYADIDRLEDELHIEPSTNGFSPRSL